MTPEAKKQLKKLVILKESPNVALFDELQELNKNLSALTEMMSAKIGMMCEHMEEMKEKEQPEMPEIDLTHTNQLLLAVLEELQKPEEKEEVEVTLDII